MYSIEFTVLVYLYYLAMYDLADTIKNNINHSNENSTIYNVNNYILLYTRVELFLSLYVLKMQLYVITYSL